MLLLICIVEELFQGWSGTKEKAVNSFKQYYNLFVSAVDKILLQYQKIYQLTKQGRL